MPVEKPSIAVEDQFDRTISESVRIRLMIEQTIFKTNSNEFSYDSEEPGGSPR